MNFKAAFFDLDGTLADTAADIAFAINSLLAEEGKPSVDFDNLRHHVARGGRSIVQFAFGDKLTEHQQDALLQRFLAIYAKNLCVDTRLFPQVIETLGQLVEKQVLIGVVTNKMQVLAEPLLERLGVKALSCCEVYGDTTANKKPSPDPLLHAARQAKVLPQHCIYVGDSLHDMKAAEAARMKGVFAAYGYGTEHVRSMQHVPQIHRFSEIMNLL